MKFNHDKAKLHVPEVVKSYLERKGITIICRPQCPVLSLSDFWHFDNNKRQLTDHTDRKSLEKEMKDTLKKNS
jgi:hypothetical protein